MSTIEIIESFKCLETSQQALILKELLNPETKKNIRKQKKAEYMKQYMANYYRTHEEYAATVRQKGRDSYKKNKTAKNDPGFN